MYGLIDKSDFETTLKTWNKIEIPPRPRRKAVIIMFTEIFFKGIFEIILIPFVISKIPVNKELEISFGTLRKLQIGSKVKEIISVMWEVFNIEIITEKSTINPPIISIVEMAEDMLSPNCSPKLEIVTFCNLFSDLEAGDIISSLEDFFQNLNNMPTLIHPKICVIKSKSPIMELPNKTIPQVPTIKRGPELLVKLINLSHSALEQIWLFLKFTAIFAPTGYPTN